MSDAAEKTAARDVAAARRAAAFAAYPLAGLTLSARFPAAYMPKPRAVVAAYWPFRTEIDPRPLMRRLARAGARIVLPITPPKGADQPMRFHLWSAEHALRAGAFGIHEPHSSAEAEPDLLLVPLLAFDRRGRRLGYGAGHYDRTLAWLRAIKSIRAIGVAFSAQEVDRVPTADHDQSLDAIVTERAFIPVF